MRKKMLVAKNCYDDGIYNVLQKREREKKRNIVEEKCARARARREKCCTAASAVLYKGENVSKVRLTYNNTQVQVSLVYMQCESALSLSLSLLSLRARLLSV